MIEPAQNENVEPKGIWARFRRAYEEFMENEGGPEMDWRTLFVLIITPVLLTIFFYYGRCG